MGTLKYTRILIPVLPVAGSDARADAHLDGSRRSYEYLQVHVINLVRVAWDRMFRCGPTLSDPNFRILNLVLNLILVLLNLVP